MRLVLRTQRCGRQRNRQQVAGKSTQIKNALLPTIIGYTLSKLDVLFNEMLFRNPCAFGSALGILGLLQPWALGFLYHVDPQTHCLTIM